MDNPERERREKPVVRLTPPVVDSVVTPAGQSAEAHEDVLDEDGQVRGYLRSQDGEYEEKAIGAELFTACAIGFINPRVHQPEERQNSKRKTRRESVPVIVLMICYYCDCYFMCARQVYVDTPEMFIDVSLGSVYTCVYTVHFTGFRDI
jgi:hypothetical protein